MKAYHDFEESRAPEATATRLDNLAPQNADSTATKEAWSWQDGKHKIQQFGWQICDSKVRHGNLTRDRRTICERTASQDNLTHDRRTI